MDSVSNATDVNSEPASIQDPLPDEDTLEPWVEWVRRCTHEAEQQLERLCIQDWVSMQRERKWNWACKLANDVDSKWSKKALNWDPSKDARYHAHRRQSRPHKRWSDDINEHLSKQLGDQEMAWKLSESTGSHCVRLMRALLAPAPPVPRGTPSDM
eukprot:3756343-Karenia_brevis.AAC.1